VANLGAKELRRRLKTDPDSIQTRDLTVLTGVAIDKVAKRERWGDEDDEDEGRRSRQFALLMERLAAISRKLVVVAPPDQGAMANIALYRTEPPIDVTPIEES
jgi:hypothetical protein